MGALRGLRLGLPGGLLGGLATALLRMRLLAEVDTAMRRLDVELVEQRLAAEFGRDLALACGLWLAGTWAARRLLRSGGKLAAALALVLLTALAWIALTGLGWAEPFHRLDLIAGARLWRQGALFAAALALGLSGFALSLRTTRRERSGTATTPAWPAALALLAVLIAPLLYGASYSPRPPSMLVTTVVGDLLAGESGWITVQSREGAAPETGVLTPALDYSTDTADLPALIMPPPCEVRFELDPEGLEGQGELVLRAAAGLDRTVRRERSYGFEILRNAEPVFSTVIPGDPGTSNEARSWRRATVPLEPGDQLTLRTWIEPGGGVEPRDGIEPGGAPATRGEPPERLGFGLLALERRERRPRAPRPTGPRPERPNLVLIVQDTLRADRLSCYGYERPTTPRLDALAERGTRFANAYSTSSWTWPATASLLTGLTPQGHGVTDDDSCYLASGNRTLAEALQQQGYSTAAFTANPLIVPERNFHQGFEWFANKRNHPFRKSDGVLPEVFDWLEVHAQTRFFLYLHLVDPHAPHRPRAEDLARLGGAPPAGFEGDDALHRHRDALLAGGDPRLPGLPELPEGYLEWWNRAYDASVATGDHHLGRLLDQFERLGLTDQTVVAFTSDHGEAWLEHGHLTHGQDVHAELVRVPLIVAGPGIPRGVVESVVSNRHLAPTLAQLGGAQLPELPDPVALLALPETTAPVTFSTQHGWWNGRQRQPIFGIRDGRYALHLAPMGSDWGVDAEDAPAQGQWRLYDVRTDPGETRDLSEQHPEQAERLLRALLARLEAARQQTPDARFGAGAQTLRMLEAIGYAGDE